MLLTLRRNCLFGNVASAFTQVWSRYVARTFSIQFFWRDTRKLRSIGLMVKRQQIWSYQTCKNEPSRSFFSSLTKNFSGFFFAAKLGHFIINYFFSACNKHSDYKAKIGKRRNFFIGYWCQIAFTKWMCVRLCDNINQFFNIKSCLFYFVNNIGQNNERTILSDHSKRFMKMQFNSFYFILNH